MKSIRFKFENETLKKKLLPFPIRLPNFQLSELLAYSCVSARYTSPPHPATLHA